MKIRLITTIIATLWLHQSSAEELSLDDITVKSNGFERKESETTYASEIHTAADIQASGASTLYDFLAQQSSLNILSNIGNKATPAINLRGFGSENGYQNVVISVDGQRLNNIDMQPALLAGIPISSIDRIEISKGSGSVLYGDGAMAGAIQIYTKAKTGVTISASAGNYGQLNNYASAGLTSDKFDLSANLAHDSYDGYAKKDITGHRDSFSSDTQQIKLKIRATDRLRMHAQATNSENDIRYINALTKAQFEANPKTAVGTYTQQAFDTRQWQLGVDYDLTSQLNLAATHYREDKTSNFITFSNEFRYDYEIDEVKARYVDSQFQLLSGYQHGTGVRKSSTSNTSKDFDAWYLNTEYHPEWLENTTLSAGYRTEKVEYVYAPLAGSRLTDANRLQAWDIGANYRFSPMLSAFANINRAYQAPDIDRFFTFTGTFNTFINPAKVSTYNIGLNHLTAQNKFKLTAFYADLNDEIYVVPGIFRNTNLDKSHKLGLELQDVYQLTDEVNVSVLYNYVKAVIDRENEGNGTFNNKNLPGAPRHSLIGNVYWKIAPGLNFNINQTWRSTAYAFNDFANNFTQKQRQYITTNVALNYQFKHITLFTAINNLFDRENVIQVQDDAIYPVDFVRTFRVGMRADF